MQLLGLWTWVLSLAVLPFVLTTWLWKRRVKSRLDWALTASAVAAFVLLAFLAAPWAALSYYLRFILLAFFAWAFHNSYRKSREARTHRPSAFSAKLATSAQAVALAALLTLDFIVIREYFCPVSPVVELAFPLSGGVYYVIPNPLHRNGSYPGQEWYALDIVKLNGAGSRATGIYPSELTAYAI